MLLFTGSSIRAARTTLEALQDILDELTHTASYNGHSEAGKTILANIKSTMSDRASAQKSFNTLLQEYRSGILPSVIQNWENIRATINGTDV